MNNKSTFILLLILISISANGYAQWEEVNSAPSGYIRDIAISNDDLYLGFFSIGVYRSTDSAATWDQLNNGLNSQQAKSIFQLLLLNGNMYAATVDGIYKSTDNGENWIKKSNGITIGPGALYEFTESIFENDGILFTGAWNGIYRSTDSGESWQITNVSGQGIAPGYFVNHNGILFAARENINFPNGYFSTDAGLTWEPLTAIPVPTITFLSEPDKLWAGTIDAVWLSTDDGFSWELKDNGLRPDPYNSSIIRVNERLITAVKFGGSDIYYSENEGELWVDFGEGLTFINSIEKLLLYGDRIFAATSDGLWQRDTTDIATGLNDNEVNGAEELLLSRNYPNPFNARTTIEFGLSNSSNVSIVVYDIRGRKIDQLYSGRLPAGKHSLTWNAGEFPSGVYFYRLRSGELNSAGKMILLK